MQQKFVLRKIQLLRIQINRQIVLRPTGDPGNSQIQVPADPTSLLRKPQEITHRTGDFAQRGWLIIRAPSGEIVHHVSWNKFGEVASAPDRKR